jgi:TonB family protein
MKSRDGSVTLKIFFNGKGLATSVKVLIGSGDPARDAACVRAYRSASVPVRKKVGDGARTNAQFQVVRIERDVPMH